MINFYSLNPLFLDKQMNPANEFICALVHWLEVLADAGNHVVDLLAHGRLVARILLE